MGSKIGYPPYIMDPVALEKEYDGVKLTLKLSCANSVINMKKLCGALCSILQ